MLITASDIIKLGSCWPDEKVLAYMPRPSSLRMLLQRTDVPTEDRIWVAMRFVPQGLVVDFAKACAAHAGHAAYADAHAAARAAAAAADTAAADAADTAAYAAAYAAAAVDTAAADAAYADAHAAERCWQIQYLLDNLEGP